MSSESKLNKLKRKWVAHYDWLDKHPRVAKLMDIATILCFVIGIILIVLGELWGI